ncbi:MAG: SDR family oxidoreductase [Anaerolineae bacterium]|nr:SDR family oxidoreductase [Anaerolineae bacterium]
MSNPLTDKIALVTGAGRGIGRAVSLALGTAGAHVVVAARTQAELEAVKQEIEQAGGTASAWPVDLSSEEEIAALFNFIRQRFGRLDVLVNNAGIGLFGPLAEFASADLDRLYTINVRGTFLCCQQALKLMIPQAGGYIINISSVVGFKGYARQGGYTITKHALMGLTKTLALEAQPHGIRVSVISPGGVDTSMIGEARPDLDRSGLLQPEDIARTVLFLLSLSEQAAIDEIYIRRRGSTPF